MCEGFHSAPVSKSFDKEIGETSVDVVIFSPCRGQGSVRRGRRFRGLRSGGLLRGSYKKLREQTQKLAHFGARDEEGREQAQREIVRAVDEQAFEQSLLDERSAIDGKLDADHQAFAANFANEAEFGTQGAETPAQLPTPAATVPKHLIPSAT